MAASSASTETGPTEVSASKADPSSSAAPGAARGWVRHLSLDSRRATVAYWSALGLFALALCIPELLPMVDYPQHLGMAEIARRLADPSSPDHAGFSLNYFTYNGLFHFLTAQLGKLLGVELAGRLVVIGSLLGLGAATVALMRALSRPPWLAALFVPAIFANAVSWGFINYALGIALAVTGVTLVAHALRRPRVSLFLATTAVGLVAGFTHVLATALFCLLAVSVTPELAWRSASADAPTSARRGLLAVWRAFLALSPLLGGGLYCIAVYVEQYSWAPGTYRDPTLEGTMPPIWEKLLQFPIYTMGVYRDYSDAVLLGLALLLLIWILVASLRASERVRVPEPAPGWSEPLLLPFVALLSTYLAIPMVFIGTHMIFPRLGQLVVLTAILALPAPAALRAPRWRKLALALAAITGVNLVGHCVVWAYETNDASAVIDELPPGRRVSSVVYDPGTLAFTTAGLVHVAAYYAPRKRSGDFAFNFARYASVPLNFRGGGQPAWPKRGWEFAPEDYNPRCNYARTFDVVIVGAPRDRADASEAVVRQMVFGQDAADVELIAHEGRFWAFDTAGLPNDGTY